MRRIYALAYRFKPFHRLVAFFGSFLSLLTERDIKKTESDTTTERNVKKTERNVKNKEKSTVLR